MRFYNPKVVATWPAPNYIDPEIRGPSLYIVNGIFLSLATIAVFTRLYTRIFIRNWFGLDDGLILLAWFCTVGDMATVFWGYSHYYWDRHMWDAKPDFLIPGTKAIFVAKIFWTSSSSFIRLSILWAYYRLLDHAQMPQYRWILHLMTFSVIGIFLSYLGTTIFACVPVDAYFFWPSPGTCIVELFADTILAVLNTISEFLIAALPIPLVFHLRMTSTQRWAVICLLCLGFFVSVVGGLRTYYVWVLFSSDDLTWYAGPHWICSEVEICLAMICACAPALRSFVGRFLTRFKATDHDTLRSSYTKRSNSTTQGGSSRSSHKKASSYATQAELLLSRSIDLEGIASRSFGYTVTITGGDRMKPKRKGSMFLPFSRGDIERSPRQRGASMDEKFDHACIEIVTRKSLELRESFDDNRSKGFAQEWAAVDI